jgi:preprotein translocase subunit SecE
VLQAQSEWLRWLAVLAGIVLAIVVFGTSPRGKSLWLFFLDSRAELRKVVWPTRTETRNITLAVFAFVAILGAFFWLLDLLLSYVVKLLGQGS